MPVRSKDTERWVTSHAGSVAANGPQKLNRYLRSQLFRHRQHGGNAMHQGGAVRKPFPGSPRRPAGEAG